MGWKIYSMKVATKVLFWKKRKKIGNENRDGVAIPISDKIDFKPKMVTGDKEHHYI